MKVVTNAAIALVAFGGSIAVHGQEFDPSRNLCPLPCSVSGRNPANWTYYHKANELKLCNQTSLFDIASFNTPIDQPGTDVTIRACALENWDPVNALPTRKHHRASGLRSREAFTGEAGPTFSNATISSSNSTSLANSTGTCSHGTPGEVTAELQQVSWTSNANSSVAVGPVIAAAEALVSYLNDEANCQPTIVLSQSGSAVVGLYVGSQLNKKSAASLAKRFIDNTQSLQILDRAASEVCGTNTSSTQVFGVFASARGELGEAHRVLREWHSGHCLSGFDEQKAVSHESLSIHSAILDAADSSSSGVKRLAKSLFKRATCKYIQAADGDGCWAAADKCKISQDDLKKYNPLKNGADLCDNNILRGMYLCCGPGDPPDFSPQPNPDGSCVGYSAKKGEGCGVIANAHSMTIEQIEERNKKSWGFAGCGQLQENQMICLSTGAPQFPNPVSTYVCGPQKMGTTKPADGTDWGSLNPCPLNACCNKWGSCGITPEFCTEGKADTGAPGTSPPGTNGCISNCGTEIKIGDSPSDLTLVGYFESWNFNRPCMHMDVSRMTDTRPNTGSPYTHIHWAFANITSDLKIDVSGAQDQFDGLKKLNGIKKIVSFGGWDFSTSPSTYMILRQATAPVNRQAFAQRVADFVKDNELDGVDFDWEYPGEPDIRGIPPGAADEGQNYLRFLTTLRGILPKEKSLSIAAPASYWYLKQFPIKQIAQVVDYIIYMTYDLHGQWDYDNKNVNEGCFNCARHHVNTTEIDYSLAMITKAGVNTNKIVVGMALYGRSFQLAQKGCKGSECKFTGPESGALKGRCTDTAGYISNYEIEEIRSQSENPDIGTFWNVAETKDFGDTIYYNDDQYISWMSPKSYFALAANMIFKNMAGLSDWATDLDGDWGDDGKGDLVQTGDGFDDMNMVCDYSKKYTTLDEVKNDSSGKRAECIVWMTMQALTYMLEKAVADYNDANNGYDEKFAAYTRYVKSMIPIAVDHFMLSSSGTAGKGFDYFDCEFTEVFHDPVMKPCREFTSLEELTTSSYDLTFILKDKDGFYKALAEDSGLPSDWIDMHGSREDIEGCAVPNGGICPPQAGIRKWHDYPDAVKEIEITNPKDAISKAIGGIDEFRAKTAAGALQLLMVEWEGKGNYDDVIESVATSISMLQDTVEYMKQAKKLGEEEEKIEKKKKLDLILNIVSAVLLVVPFAGEVGLSLLGATKYASMIAKLSWLGQFSGIGFSVYEFKQDQTNISALFGFLIGPIGGGVGAIANKLDIGLFREIALKARFVYVDLASRAPGYVRDNRVTLEALKQIRGYCKA